MRNPTRRELMAGAAAVPAAGLAAVPAAAATETPSQRVDRLSRELSEALNEHMGGQFVAEIWPSDHEEWPLRFIARRARTDHPDAELVELGRRYDELATRENRLAALSRKMRDEGPEPVLPMQAGFNPEFVKWERDSGFVELLRQIEALCKEFDPIGREIMSRPATTLAGIAAKAKVARHWLPKGAYWDDEHNPLELEDVDDFADQLLRQFVEDLIALGDPEEGAQS